MRTGLSSNRWHRAASALILGFAVVATAGAGSPGQADSSGTVTRSEGAASPNSQPSSRSGPTRAQRHEELIERAMSAGSVPVIVRLKSADEPGSSSASSAQSSRAATQESVLNQLGMKNGRDRSGATVKRFSQVPDLALRADAIDLLDLLDDPSVLDVFEDIAYPPALLESAPLIGAVGGSFRGYSGVGQVVAILDTGVDKSHPFLSGKVISEACYSSHYPSIGVISLCPGNVGASTASDSARHCNTSVSGCMHGTHVAGIAAGRGSGFSGVARDANLIAIQVFSQFPSSDCGGSPCVKAYTSDIIKGLERVAALRSSYAIAAANLSLGGGLFSNPCDGDPMKPVIDRLRTAGIATVIASGNDGSFNAVSSPGCISTAITVGSTTKSDTVSWFSNSASFLDLLAPGSAINSSIPFGGFARWDGTSMATPHVAGAWAVVKSARPTASVQDVLSALQRSGQPVRDSRSQVAVPRIQVDEAVALITGTSGVVPTAPVAGAAEAVARNRFTANWRPVARARGYRLDVSTSRSFQTYVPGYEHRDVGNARKHIVKGLRRGTTYYMRVLAYNEAGASRYSAVRKIVTRR